jgi:colicin import membrane protein
MGSLLKRWLDWRQPGGAVSAVGHVAVLVVGLVGFSAARPFEPASESVAVDVVSEKDFNEMMKGDKTSKIVAKEPERRVDRVDPVKRDNDPGDAKKDVAAPEPPKASPSPPPQLAAVTPPARPPELRVAPPQPAPAPKAEEDDEEDEKAELLRRRKAAEDEKRLEEAKAAAEAKRKLEEKLKTEAEAQKRIEEQKKAEDARKAEEARKAELARREKEAKEKARREKEAKEKADEQKLLAAITNKLNTSRETPSSTGSTGQQVASRSTAGNTEATGKKLSPSDRSQLIGLLTEQMNRCISYSGSAPKTGPQILFTLGRDGAITSNVQLANRSGEPTFMPFSEAAMRALRNCQPYKIPARFMDTYDDWKNVRLNIDTSEMQ